MSSNFNAILVSHWQLCAAVGLAVLSLSLMLVGVRAWLRGKRMAAPAARAGFDAEDPFHLGSIDERRVAARRGGKTVDVLVTDAEAKTKPQRGWVVDRSQSGLRLCAEWEPQEGTIVSVRACNAPTTVPWVQVEIRNRVHNSDHWEMGCQFVKRPPWSILLLFG